MAAGVLGLAGAWLLARVPAAPDTAPPAPPARSVPAPAPDAGPGPTAGAPPTTARVPRLPPVGRRVVRDALDRRIAEAGLDAQVDEAERQALMQALARVRRANLARQRLPQTHEVRERRDRAVRDADDLFRRTLGIGVHEFLAEEGQAGNVEDLGRGRR